MKNKIFETITDSYKFMYSLVISSMFSTIVLILILIMLCFITKKMYSKSVVQSQSKSDEVVCVDKTTPETEIHIDKTKKGDYYTVEYVVENKKGIYGSIYYHGMVKMGKVTFSKDTYPQRTIKKWSYKFSVSPSDYVSNSFYASLKYYGDSSGTTSIKLYINDNLIDHKSCKYSYTCNLNCTLTE